MLHRYTYKIKTCSVNIEEDRIIVYAVDKDNDIDESFLLFSEMLKTFECLETFACLQTKHTDRFTCNTFHFTATVCANPFFWEIRIHIQMRCHDGQRKLHSGI